MKVEVIRKDVAGFKGEAWLVKKGEEYYYVVSGVFATTGREALVFPANEKGEVTGWGDIAGGRGCTHEDAILELEIWGQEDE